MNPVLFTCLIQVSSKSFIFSTPDTPQIILPIIPPGYGQNGQDLSEKQNKTENKLFANFSDVTPGAKSRNT